ncbi:hypothetical protein NEAUS03_0661 [Nematocida ausubeli]|nr:hypothetical protein NEAUS03_0661 [Nematocida ausubeli]
MHNYAMTKSDKYAKNNLAEELQNKLRISSKERRKKHFLADYATYSQNSQSSKDAPSSTALEEEEKLKRNKKGIRELIKQIRNEINFTATPYEVIENLEDLIWLEESIRETSPATKVRYISMGINTEVNPNLALLKRKMKEYQELLEIKETAGHKEEWKRVKDHLTEIICQYANEKKFKLPSIKSCYYNWEVWVSRVLSNIWCSNYTLKELKEEIMRGKNYPVRWDEIDFTQTPNQIREKLIKYSEYETKVLEQAKINLEQAAKTQVLEKPLQKAQTKKIVCTGCKKTGHTTAHCYLKKKSLEEFSYKATAALMEKAKADETASSSTSLSPDYPETKHQEKGEKDIMPYFEGSGNRALLKIRDIHSL